MVFVAVFLPLCRNLQTLWCCDFRFSSHTHQSRTECAASRGFRLLNAWAHQNVEIVFWSSFASRQNAVHFHRKKNTSTLCSSSSSLFFFTSSCYALVTLMLTKSEEVSKKAENHSKGNGGELLQVYYICCYTEKIFHNESVFHLLGWISDYNSKQRNFHCSWNII